MSREWYEDVPRSTRRFTIAGLIVLGVSVFGFGVWGSTAPIAGAVVASGIFVTNGQNKIVQHLEGGVINELRVREGDFVEAGETLVTLDETASKAELRRLDLRLMRLEALEARLVAEVEQAEVVAFPDELLARAEINSDLAATLASERLGFDARRDTIASEIASLQAGMDALRERLQGSQVQRAATAAQLLMIEEELADKERLLEAGISRKADVLALRRAQAGLQGEIGRLVGEIGDSKERSARIAVQIAGIRNDARRAAIESLHQTRAEIDDIRERRRAAMNILARARIEAPVSGTVVKLRYNTPGGVIEAGKAILEIVPHGAALLIEVNVRPQDINSVRLGQPTTVRLTALNKRTTPTVAGRVEYVSADALPDDTRPQAGIDVYIARISLDEKSAREVAEFRAMPGMPAEVYIETAERTFMHYLMQPILDSMARAFRED